MIRLLFCAILISSNLSAQPNPNYYLHIGDTAMYNACIAIKDLDSLYQFRREIMEMLNESIEICPRFAYAYWEKSAIYVKSGDFIRWKENFDKAVQYAPDEYLGFRGALRAKFFADYQGAIQDIEEAEKRFGDPGYTNDGNHHLNFYKAICYINLGEKDKAIGIMENELQTHPERRGYYDYLHLAVLYLEKGELDKAWSYLQKQKALTNTAECEFYISKTLFLKHSYREAKVASKKCKELFLHGNRFDNGFSVLTHQIFRSDIESLEQDIERALLK